MNSLPYVLLVTSLGASSFTLIWTVGQGLRARSERLRSSQRENVTIVNNGGNISGIGTDSYSEIGQDSSRTLRLLLERIDQIGSASQSRPTADRELLHRLESLERILRELPSSSGTPAGGSLRKADDLVSLPENTSARLGVRELSHALGSPLVQIGIYASLLRTLKGHDDVKVLESHLDGIDAGVRLCQSLLAGYRRLGDLPDLSDASLDSLSLVSIRLADFFTRDGARNVRLSVNGEIDSSGYSASMFVVLVLPLLENAFEESSGPIEFEVSRTDAELIATIRNPSDCALTADEVCRDGYSSKAGHQGIGLSAVQRIARSVGGELYVDIRDRIFSASVRVPTRRSGGASL